MIELNYYKGEILLFEVNDWFTLRKTYRIIGSLVGNTNSIIQTLPLKLLPEEVLLLLDKGIVKVVDRKFDITPEDQKKQVSFENELLEQEKVVYRNVRKRQLEIMIGDIVAAKRKRGDNRSSEEIFNEELEKSSQIIGENMIWPVLLKSAHSIQITYVHREDILQKTSELKYHIFKDLWEKGYHITTGYKFGADFLVYLGDPISYHALFIVHCVENPDQGTHCTEIVAIGRLSSAVKKRAVLASVKDGIALYITINWIDA